MEDRGIRVMDGILIGFPGVLGKTDLSKPSLGFRQPSSVVRLCCGFSLREPVEENISHIIGQRPTASRQRTTPKSAVCEGNVLTSRAGR